MWNKFKDWHKGLSLAGKILLWSATVIVFFGVIGASASPDTQVKEEETTETSQQPERTTKTVTETEQIPFAKSTVDDPSLEKGKSQVQTMGVNGVKTKTYEIIYEGDNQVSKKLIKEETTREPVTEVTANGTKVAEVAPAQTSAPSCDPNYSGACVPIASDVDCAGGSGNGPAYVSGPVYVVGNDIYGLDRNSDGVGCE